jgi:hypothetical protein
MRIPFAVVSAFKLLPLFVWLRLSVGTAGAVVGTALLACSFWDVVLSRIPNNHNALIVSIVFALLAGPARRGRPSAYVLLGFFGGYILHEYIAYRPLALLAIVGAVAWSLRDRTDGWLWRVARPLITAVLLVTMVIPLFFTRLHGGLKNEYFDGWNRAHAIAEYYNTEHTWRETIDQRIGRARMATDLFIYHGDRSPVRNIASQPTLIDPVTCVLLVLGIAAAAANALRPVFGLTLLGCLITVSGTLIMTGNFDVARVGGAVPYVYVLAGIGAAGLWTTWTQAWGRSGRVVAGLVLAVAVAAAGVWCTRNLFELWTDPVIKRAHRNNLAYLAAWMGRRLQPDERVLGIAPGFDNALGGHDGSWLRGREVEGYVGWDLEAVLRRWESEKGPTLFFVYVGKSTPAVATYLEGLFPGLKFEIDPDPLDLTGDIAWARVPGPPPELAERLAEWKCRGVHATFTVDDKGATILKVDTVAPFICRSTWPGKIPEQLYRMPKPPTAILARYEAPFTVQGGEYRFALEMYVGSGELIIDGVRRDSDGRVPVPLAEGLHQLLVTAKFAPMAAEPSIRLLWSGPDTGQRQQLMPFYRLTPVDPSCASSAGQAPYAAAGRDGRAGYLTNWLALGPFDNRDGANAPARSIDDVKMSTDPAAAAAGGQQWTPIAAKGSFIDLDSFYAPTAANGSPQAVCAYVTTRIDSPAARAAFLELAGSGDALQVWLNGVDLTLTPLFAGYEPQRHPIELRAGSNLLMVKSCEDVGAWYFIARLADAEGHDIPDLHASAALPSEPLPPGPPTADGDVQLVEGFATVLAAPHEQADYPDQRGGGPSSWTYVEDHNPVVWRTAPLPTRRPTILVLTAATSEVDAMSELSVNGRSALVFSVGTDSINGRWQGNGYEAAFVSRGYHGGNSGVLLVSVPAEAVTPGEPLELRVALGNGHGRAWFMVKRYADTIAYEKLSPRTAVGLIHPGWESVPRVAPVPMTAPASAEG